MDSTVPINLLVPETIIIGFKFPSNVYMHNKMNRRICFEELVDEDKIKNLVHNWAIKNGNSTDPIAVAKYIVNSSIQSYPLVSESSAISECTYLQFPNKIIQKYIPNENLVKTTWSRKKKTFEIEILNQKSVSLKFTTSSRSSLPDIRKISPKSKEISKKRSLGRFAKEELKEISFYLIEKLYYFMKKYKKAKLNSLEFIFAKNPNQS